MGRNSYRRCSIKKAVQQLNPQFKCIVPTLVNGVMQPKLVVKNRIMVTSFTCLVYWSREKQSSYRKCSVNKGVINSTKFTGKHL